MSDFMNSFKLAKKYILEDKINILLVMIPFLMGAIIYALTFRFLYTHVFVYLLSFVKNFFQIHFLNEILSYFLVMLFSFFIYTLINWTFVVIISFLASPFYNALSSRIERKYFHREETRMTLKESLGRFFFIFINEGKKIFFILLLTFLSLFLNYFPSLAPIAVLVASVLFSVQFIDYTWSRHHLSFSDCLKNFFRHFIPYTLMGFVFFILIHIPILNILLPAYAVAVYTIYYNLKTKPEIQLEIISHE